jgi:hypothetical protein
VLQHVCDCINKSNSKDPSQIQTIPGMDLFQSGIRIYLREQAASADGACTVLRQPAALRTPFKTAHPTVGHRRLCLSPKHGATAERCRALSRRQQWRAARLRRQRASARICARGDGPSRRD